MTQFLLENAGYMPVFEFIFPSSRSNCRIIRTNLMLSYHDVMKTYKKPILFPLKHIPTIFWALVSVISMSIAFPTLTHAYETQPTIWVQVPQWSDDWEKCAVDVPDSACHWYVANADNTFGEGFDWENAPWYSVEGLKDVAPISKKTVVEKLQETK